MIHRGIWNLESKNVNILLIIILKFEIIFFLKLCISASGTWRFAIFEFENPVIWNFGAVFSNLPVDLINIITHYLNSKFQIFQWNACILLKYPHKKQRSAHHRMYNGIQLYIGKCLFFYRYLESKWTSYMRINYGFVQKWFDKVYITILYILTITLFK